MHACCQYLQDYVIWSNLTEVLSSREIGENTTNTLTVLGVNSLNFTVMYDASIMTDNQGKYSLYLLESPRKLHEPYAYYSCMEKIETTIKLAKLINYISKVNWNVPRIRLGLRQTPVGVLMLQNTIM